MELILEILNIIFSVITVLTTLYAFYEMFKSLMGTDANKQPNITQYATNNIDIQQNFFKQENNYQTKVVIRRNQRNDDGTIEILTLIFASLLIVTAIAYFDLVQTILLFLTSSTMIFMLFLAGNAIGIHSRYKNLKIAAYLISISTFFGSLIYASITLLNLPHLFSDYFKSFAKFPSQIFGSTDIINIFVQNVKTFFSIMQTPYGCYLTITFIFFLVILCSISLRNLIPIFTSKEKRKSYIIKKLPHYNKKAKKYYWGSHELEMAIAVFLITWLLKNTTSMVNLLSQVIDDFTTFLGN